MSFDFSTSMHTYVSLLSANIADAESALFLEIRFAVDIAGGEIAFFPLVSTR